MKILSHRGYWNNTQEKNTTIAFNRSFDSGYGTETDVRDIAGRLVISHDMPFGDELDFDEFLKLLKGRSLPLALNVKCDGLVTELVKVIRRHEVDDWFVFDMAVPDMKSYLLAGVPVFTRMSEVELQPVCLERSVGVWLDSFDGDWYDNSVIEELLELNKRVCIVSPELHQRNHLPLWRQLFPLVKNNLLMLCTDMPKEATEFFGINNEN